MVYPYLYSLDQSPLYRKILFLLPLFIACKTTQRSPEPPETTPTAGTILTVIFEVDPALDTLTVFDIIRGPGRLRTEYGPTAVAGPGDLLFSFLDADDQILRQTAKPYPRPNRYEVPTEEGGIESVMAPEETRSLVLKTQGSRRLRFLTVSRELPSGVTIRQRIDLRPVK